MRKIWDIHGGVHPPENKHQSNQTPISTIDLPDVVVLPLNQHIGAPAEPIVEIGDHVLTGQMIAKPMGVFSAAVHASISGEIIAIEDRVIPHPSGMSAPCIVIKSDGQDTAVNYLPLENYLACDHQTLVNKIRDAGIAGMGGAGFPTSVKVNPHAGNVIDTLILNGTECEPYITADDVLMREQADKIISGAKILSHILGSPKNVLIGIEDNKPEAISTMQKAAKDSGIEIVKFPTKYPSGGEKQLIQILTGKEVKSGQIPAQIGIVVQNIGTAAAIHYAVVEGKPLIERVTTIVGQALTTQRNIRVRIGTPIDHILERHGFKPERSARLIIGGPMMGYAVEQTSIPVVKTTNCILVPSHQEMPEPPPAQACIRCGHCAEACPANLLPQQLYWYAKSEDTEKLQAHNIMDCIECGACSFVCPSAIPLVQYYRAGKGLIRKQEQEKKKSDQARQRFENRQARIAKIEAEKEAKRQKRKAAAEAAKQKLADKPNSEKTAANTGATKDPVSNAVERAKQGQAEQSPEKARAKLQRSLSSAQSRMDRVQKQIATAKEENDQAKIDKALAQEKQAQLKIDQAQAKLDEFDQSQSGDTLAPTSGKSNENTLDAQAQKIQEKLISSPVEQQEKVVNTLKKRIATATEKWEQAKADNAPTAAALEQGLEKLRIKLSDAEASLQSLQVENVDSEKSAPATAEQSAAEKAIQKAKEKAAKAANMTPEEKHAAQIESLQNRIVKARARLDKAKEENNDNVDAFATALEKLEVKLQELTSTEPMD